MTAVIDNKLTLVYKKMVGLSNIINTSGDSFFTGSVSVNSNLFVCGTTILNSATTINSNLNISGLSLFNGPMSINSSLNISGSTMINGPTTVNSSLTISGTTNINNSLIINGTAIYNGPTTNTSNFFVSGTAVFQNGINVNNINGNVLNINAPTINIGNANSIVYINGTTTYVASSETLIVDKIISLNVNSTTLQGADIGNLSGIEIMGISSLGFIMTNADASRYQIKTPLLGAPTNYITIQDLNNNLIISGTTTLIGASSINSSLNVSGISIFNGSTTMNSSLNISGSTVISGYCTINNSITISGTTVINNACSINSSLNVSGLTNINNQVTVNGSLNVSGSTNIKGLMTIQSLLNISGTTNINNATSINSSLNVSGLTVINGPISMNSYLNVSGFCNIMGNETVTSSLFVSSGTIFNSSITINSTLVISGSSIFNNNVSMNSNLGVFGQMVASMPNYLDNTSAKIGGVPVWGWYITGGIIKIRLNDAPPTIYITGSTSLSINFGSSYTEPGALAIDYFNNKNSVYFSIVSGTSNLISNIVISGTTTLITQTTVLPIGSYTATYSATDSMDNTGYNYRLLTINPPPPTTYILIPYVTNNIIYSYNYDINNIRYPAPPLFSNNNMLWNNTMLWNTPSVANFNSATQTIPAGTFNDSKAWGLSTSYLNSINFNYQSSWCFVFKMNTQNDGNKSRVIQFDETLNGWYSGTKTWGQYTGPKWVYFYTTYPLNGSSNNSFSITNYTNATTPLTTTGIYVSMSYNITTKIIYVELLDMSGNLLSKATSDPYTFVSTNSPWSFYMSQNLNTFYKFIYYNKTGYVPYSEYNNLFV